MSNYLPPKKEIYWSIIRTLCYAKTPPEDVMALSNIAHLIQMDRVRAVYQEVVARLPNPPKWRSLDLLPLVSKSTELTSQWQWAQDNEDVYLYDSQDIAAQLTSLNDSYKWLQIAHMIQIGNQGLDNSLGADDVINQMMLALNTASVASGWDGIKLHNLDDLVDLAYDIGDPAKHKNGLMTGFQLIDNAGGLPFGLTIASAPVNHGKTHLAIYLFLRAIKQGMHPSYIGLEMTTQALAERLIWSMATDQMHDQKLYQLSNKKFESLIDSLTKNMDGKDLACTISKPAGNPEDITCLLQHAQACGAKAIFLDYVQLINPPASYKRGRDQWLNSQLQIAAKFGVDNNLVIVVAAQLNGDGNKDSGDPATATLSDSATAHRACDCWLNFANPPQDRALGHIRMIIRKWKEGDLTGTELPLDVDLSHSMFWDSADAAWISAGKPVENSNRRITGGCRVGRDD